MALSGYVSRDEAKDQINMERANTTQDERIDRLLEAAEEAACNFMNIDTLDDLQDSPVESPATIPESVKSAILMHFEMEYDRDERTWDKLRASFEALLWPYRTNVGV